MSEQFNKFQLIVIKRISDHKEAEAKRQEAEHIRLMAEEQAKLQPLATGKQSLQVADHIEQPLAMVDTGKTLKLGEICTRLGFTVTADFLASLGFDPVATDKNAKLYAESKFPTICRLISEHVMALSFKNAA